MATGEVLVAALGRHRRWITKKRGDQCADEHDREYRNQGDGQKPRGPGTAGLGGTRGGPGGPDSGELVVVSRRVAWVAGFSRNRAGRFLHRAHRAPQMPRPRHPAAKRHRLPSVRRRPARSGGFLAILAPDEVAHRLRTHGDSRQLRRSH
jgi:hypothetical protein